MPATAPLEEDDAPIASSLQRALEARELAVDAVATVAAAPVTPPARRSRASPGRPHGPNSHVSPLAMGRISPPSRCGRRSFGVKISATAADRPRVDAAAPTPRRHRTDRDLGTTFIEILVAIVLLGMTVVATLVALSSTLVATALDRDHANAHAWL